MSEKATLAEALLDMETGICLWIGAGVTKNLAFGLGGTVPDWNDITVDLERLAGIATPPDSSVSNPERLHACMEVLGASPFRQAVSRRIYGELCRLIATYAHSHRGRLAEPPTPAFDFAAIAWLANPIVNFNVETFTSYLVARPGGPCRILPYRIRDVADASVPLQQETSSDFFRTVYHPHGAVNYGGQAVMTSGEYQAHDGSLAYLLSVSAAFENNLWIVGMSLDDEYLRDHLKRHRKQINRVSWFNVESELRKHADWAVDARVRCVPVAWPDFWSTIRRELGGQVRRSGVMTAWFHVLNTGIRELTTGGPAAEWEALAKVIPDLLPAAQRVRLRAKATYEHVFDDNEGRRLLPQGFDEAAIAAEIADAVKTSADLVNTIQAKVGEIGDDVGRDIASALEEAKPRLPTIRLMNV